MTSPNKLKAPQYDEAAVRTAGKYVSALITTGHGPEEIRHIGQWVYYLSMLDAGELEIWFAGHIS